MTLFQIKLFPRASVAIAAVMFITACGSDTDVTELEVIDNTEEVQAYYSDNPDFFIFKTLADMPTDLTWLDGSHLPDIGSPDAMKGGTQYASIQDFPRTLRVVGPDSNGSFRPLLLDDTTLQLGHRHPNAFEYFPALAQQWSVDQENKTVYIKLHDNATWSDGERITSNDFMFMFFFMRSPHIVAPWYNNWYTTQYVNITKYDDLHFSITIPEAKPDMDSRVLELRPMPQHFYKELGPDFVERYQWRFQPNTGPYVIHEKDIKKGQSIALTRNENWWAKDNKFFKNRFNADRIHISVIRDTTKAFEAFKRGDIDQFGLNLAEYWYDKLPDEDADVQSGYIHKSLFYNQPPRPTRALWINSHKPLLNNADIREGIQHATNWQLVIERFFRNDK